MSNHNDRADAAKVLLGTTYDKTVTVSSRLNPKWTGDVTFSLPNGRDLARIAVIQYDLREGRPLHELDPLSGGTIVALSTLAVVVRSAPEWWYRTEGEGKNAKKIPAPELFLDQHVIWDLWGEYVAFRDTFPGRADDTAVGEVAGGTPAVSVGEEVRQAAV